MHIMLAWQWTYCQSYFGVFRSASNQTSGVRYHALGALRSQKLRPRQQPVKSTAHCFLCTIGQRRVRSCVSLKDGQESISAISCKVMARLLTYNGHAWSGRAGGMPPSMAALSAVTCPGQPSPQLPQAYIHQEVGKALTTVGTNG